ncbi:MAG: type II secretion system protein GspE [Candidatus Omnitrophota bacterium]|nr:MAG: type II secretion system protein GspE [Candidatus Omnitrophota bacterium]
MLLIYLLRELPLWRRLPGLQVEKRQVNMKEVTLSEELQQMLRLSEKLNIPFLRLSCYDIPKEATELLSSTSLSVQIALQYKVIPVAKFGPVVTVAMADPLNVLILDELKNLLGMEVTPVVAMPSEIIGAINLYSTSELKLEKIKVKEEKVTFQPLVIKEEKIDVYELKEISAKEKVVQTVNNILIEAIKFKASDIHLEPYKEHLRLRYRIDGVLRFIKTFPKDMQDALIARLKIMSKLDITERRLSQDGRFSISFEERSIDFRVSVLPTYYGEKVVLRILDKEAMKMDLASLGFSFQPFEIYNEAILSPFGLLLITGPTGSGKSTTLYSMLSKLNTLDKNITTIEDPIEYHLKGVTQIQIKPEIGLSFAQCLRAVLRQSPDIIMVGEIRDIETADIAMKSALTGHLVLSTLHTNDALSAIPRLLDMGIEPFLVAGGLRMVSAQRLCRKLCSRCKEKYLISREELRKFSVNITEDKVEVFRAKGCDECNHIGYKGRTAIAEAFLIDNEISEMIINRKPLAEIHGYAKSKGMVSLREDGFRKAFLGETSLEEVLRVTAET